MPLPAPPHWPRAADPAAAQRLVERFAGQGAAAAALAGGAAGAAMLAAVGGGSPFLSDLVVREHATACRMAEIGPDAALAEVMASLAAVTPQATRAQVMAGLRRAKRRAGLVTALADIGGMWGLARVTGVLTALAEAALRLAVGHLLLAAHAKGELRLADPSRPEDGSGLIVLGMGKLGARELNFSSDIDLILLFDPDAHPESDNPGATFTRIARSLVTVMETRDAEGYVFRTDLRLRPDPAATPPAVALPGAIAYYESLGQNWERAAMTKARPVAGDIARGFGFLEAIRPFVWRRRLDFAAIADLHAMKRRIDEHRGFAAPGHREDGTGASLAGANLKLGPGGIREVEFAAQTLQLVWGGRDSLLRDPTTLGALRRLWRGGHLARRAAAELTLAYRLLRRVEHRLQMVADRQTHELPEKPEALQALAVFLGCADAAAMEALLRRHMARVHARYAEVFETVPPAQGTVPLDLAGPDLPEGTAARLRQLGFHSVEGMVATLRGWHAGRLRALRSARARELMDEVLPPLLEALGRQADPDAAFNRFDAMLARQPAGVHLLSLFQRNPAVLERVAAVLGASPSLADHLAGTPSALEGLLAPPQAASLAPGLLLARRLGDATAPEEVAAATIAMVRGEEFRLCCAQMEGALDVDAAGLARTSLADAALQALLPVVLAEHARRFGTVPGGDMAVLALGKAGSREMMAGSDLDLMLIYDHPAEATESVGGRSLAASQWFIRAAHAFVAALTAPSREGRLYDVDMRLRPSGNKGPVAVPLAGFQRYHAAEAWTWERMALTRARVVAGNPAIAAAAQAAVQAALAIPLEAAQVRADAVDMRRRLLRDLPPTGKWDVKLRPGGGMEVEFIAQVLQLVHGMREGGQNTGLAFQLLAQAGALHPGEAAVLARADLMWRTVQSMLRITVGRAPGAALPGAAETAVLRAAGRVAGRTLDAASLDATLEETAHAVRGIFNTRIGEVG